MFKTEVNQTAQSGSTGGRRPCKLCSGSHSMLKCVVYTDAGQRIRRLNQLELCTACSGQHKVTDCPSKKKGLTYPCNICSSASHITAVCKSQSNQATQNKLCLMGGQHGQQILLPSVSAVMNMNGKAELIKCLIDHDQ